MKFPVTVIAFASVSLALTGQTPASASPKQQGSAPRHMSFRPAQTKPTVPVQAATVRQDSTQDGNDIAIRLQDAHRGEGPL
jgi:hypothetical protein